MNLGLTITTLGKLNIQQNGSRVTGFSSRKAEALLVYLAVERGNPIRRESLFTLLWPGMPEKSARHNLRQVLYSLGQTFPEVTIEGNEFAALLLADRKSVRINPEAAVEVDVHQLDRNLQKTQVHDHLSLGSCDNCIQTLVETVTLYGGEFLGDYYLEDSNAFEDWAQANREAYRIKILETLGSLADIFIQRADYDQARTYANQQLKIDPLREIAYRQLMELLSKSGQRAEALRVYQQCTQVLEIELGTQPSRETTALFEIIRGENLQESASLIREGSIRGFEIREHLGSGHTGAVYKAYQPVIGRDVAIKVILPQFANHPDFIRRFEVEAQLIARLEHPHIVPLYDYWRDPSGAYLVMRWLKGGNLQVDLSRGPWKPAAAVELVDQISAALSLAHRQGVVHCDIKPANILLDEESNAYLTDFGIAILTGPLAQLSQSLHSGNGDSSSGSLGYVSPETARGLVTTPLADIYSLGVVLYELLTGTHPFPGVEGEALVQKHLTEPLPSVLALRSELPERVDDVIQKATQKDPAGRYLDVETLSREFRRALIPESIALRDISKAMVIDRNPYKGLRPFAEADAVDFFGREDLVARMLGRLARSDQAPELAHFLVVVGPSGSGKSSVVKAGLIPAIRKGALPESEHWFVAEMTPGAHPLEELETALLRIAIETPEDLLAQLTADPRAFVRLLRRAIPGVDHDVLLVIDQFEETFTLVEDEAERNHFLEMLATAVCEPHSPLQLVITLRADFYDRPLGHSEFGELVRGATEVVLPLTPEEMERAINGPAEGVGAKLESALVARILQEIGDQPGALPLLQYALTETFENREDRQLTLAAYEANGGMLGALGRRAEEIYTNLNEQEKEMTRQLFLRLVTLGEGIEDTRRRVPRSELEGISPDRGRTGDHPQPGQSAVEGSSILGPVIDRFGKHRLLTFDHDPATRAPTVEVAHEALLREWSRLRAWLDENRADIRMQRLLEAGTLEWLAADRDPGFLLRGARLDQFALWMKDSDVALTADEGVYLAASLEKRREREAAKAERQAHEKHLEKRSRRVLRALVAVLSIGIVIAGALSIFAFTQRQSALEQANIASARELAAAAVNNLDVDIERSILLAIQAVEVSRADDQDPLPEAVSALHQAVNASRLLYTLPHGGSAAYSPDGTRLATGGNDDTVKVWNLATQEVFLTLVGHEDDILDVAFSPDGSLLASTSVDKTARIWDANTGDELLTLPAENQTFFRLAFSSDNTRLAVTSFYPPGTVTVWDVVIGEKLLTLQGHTSDVLDVTFSLDGEFLVTGSWDFTARVWDARSGEELYLFDTGSIDFISGLAFSPDRRYLAMALQNLGVVIYDWNQYLKDGEFQSVRAMNVQSGFTTCIAYSPDGSQIAIGNSEGTLIVWDTESGRELFTQAAHTNGINSLAFSPDGRYLATSSPEDKTKVWDLTPEGSREWRTITGFLIPNIAFSPDGKLFAVNSSPDKRTTVMDTVSGDVLLQLTHPHESWYVVFSPDGRLLGIPDFGGSAGIWELNHTEDGLQATALFTVTHSDNILWGLAFNPDGSQFVTGGSDGIVKVWDAKDGRELYSWDTKGDIIGMRYSPDGTSLATAHYGPTKVWDPRTGELLHSLVGHERSSLSKAPTVNDLAYSQDGSKLVTAGWDYTARVWDVASGELLLTLSGHSGWVVRAQFSPDDKILATASNDGTIRLWDAETGEALGTLTGHSQSAFDVAFSPDGRLLATSGLVDGTVRFYVLDENELIAIAKDRVTRSLTDEECQQFLHLEQCP